MNRDDQPLNPHHIEFENDDSDQKELERGRIHSLVQSFSNVILVLGVILLFAVTFTIPFPFVRRIWLSEIWGYYGLGNALLFIVISRQMKHMSLAGALAGAGIVLHDQLITWRGFFYLQAYKMTDQKSIYFVILAFFMSLFIAVIFLYSAYGMVLYRKLGTLKKASHNLVTHLMLGVLYSVALAGLPYVYHLSIADSYGIMRLMGALVAPAGLYGSGLCVETMLKERKGNLFSSALLLFHTVSTGTLLVLIYRLMPLEQIILNR